MEILKYNGYEGTTELDSSRGMYRGKILLTSDLVTYESSTISGLQQEFEIAVDDYVETCKTLGKQPQAASAAQGIVRASQGLTGT
jgi:predicted HicB family RNase H-like nuclease